MKALFYLLLSIGWYGACVYSVLFGIALVWEVAVYAIEGDKLIESVETIEDSRGRIHGAWGTGEFYRRSDGISSGFKTWLACLAVAAVGWLIMLPEMKKPSTRRVVDGVAYDVPQSPLERSNPCGEHSNTDNSGGVDNSHRKSEQS